MISNVRILDAWMMPPEMIVGCFGEDRFCKVCLGGIACLSRFQMLLAVEGVIARCYRVLE